MWAVDRVWKAGLLGLVMLTAGCGAGLQPVCRHTAMMCALVMQEKYDRVEVAFGPVINANRETDPLVTHAQTRVKVGEKWMWVNYNGGVCQLTNKQEMFLALNHYSTEMFYAWLWKDAGQTANAALPTMNFKDAISITEASIY